MTTGLDALDRAIEKTNVWLKELMAELGWADRNRTYAGLRAVLHALRDRLTPNEAVHLAAQFPMVIRGFYYEGWDPARTPTPLRTKEDFLAQVAEPLLRVEEVEPEALTRAVFKILARKVTGGEIANVTQILPAPIKELWPGGRTAAALPRAAVRKGEARKARRAIRRTMARARVRGVASQDLPLLQTPRNLRAGARRKAEQRKRQAPSQQEPAEE
jgi:uncharacterized protein (DUF2267 family)